MTHDQIKYGCAVHLLKFGKVYYIITSTASVSVELLLESFDSERLLFIINFFLSCPQ